MNDIEIIDIILEKLYKEGGNGIGVKVSILRPKGISLNDAQYARVLKILIDDNDNLAEMARDQTDAGDDDLIISKHGIKIYEKFGSYSGFIKKTNREKFWNRVSKVIAAGGALGSLWFAYLNFEKGNELDLQNQQLERCQKMNDSLKEELSVHFIPKDSIHYTNIIAPPDSERSDLKK